MSLPLAGVMSAMRHGPADESAMTPRTGMRMDIKEIKALVKLMVDSGLSELDISEGDNKIHLKRATAEALVQTVAMPVTPVLAAAAPSAMTPIEAKSAPAETLLEIRSPMVGTFYSAPSPDSEPFIKPGTRVSEDNVACIIEAMKVMNEIKAECSGTVVEIAVKNAQPVEYGQVLFRVRPD